MTRALLTLGLLVVSGTGTAWGQSATGLIPPPVMARYGLVRTWYGQVELDSAEARVGYVTLHVSRSHALTIIDMIFSWFASSRASSPRKAPSFIT